MDRIELQRFMEGLTEAAIGGEVVGCAPFVDGREPFPAFQVKRTDGCIVTFFVKTDENKCLPGNLAGWKDELLSSKVIRGGSVEEGFDIYPFIEVQTPDGRTHILKATLDKNNDRPGFFWRDD